MDLDVDLYFSFRSPYSYLASGRLADLAARYALCFHLRPVLPLAVRETGFFTARNPAWVPYLLRDTMRIAQMHRIPYGWPRPDPVTTDPATLDATADQPHIHRLTRLGVAAEERGRGLAFACEVARLIWSGEINGWDQGDHLAEAAARAGLALDELDTAIAAAPRDYAARVAANQDALAAAGHWGVPCMVFQGEPFFGQDRIDVLLWRLKQHGLKARVKR